MSQTPWILVGQVEIKWTKKWISERDKRSKWNNDWKASNLFANAFHSVVQPRTWLNMNSRGEVSSSLVHLEGKNRWSNRVSIWKILIYTFKTNWVHWTPFLVLRSHKIDVFYWSHFIFEFNVKKDESDYEPDSGWWIFISTSNRFQISQFKFRVVLYRIRLFPTWISNIKWLGYP